MEQWGQEKNWFYASAYTDGAAGSGDKRNIRHDFPDATTARPARFSNRPS